MTKTDNKNELELLAQEIFVLQQNSNRTHEEDKKLHTDKVILCKKAFCAIFRDESQQGRQDYLLFNDAFEEIIKKNSSANEKPFIERIIGRYRVKCNGKRSESFEEEDVEEAELRKKMIRGELRKIASKHGMPTQKINAELKKFNPLNSRKVHEFLSSNFGFSPEELGGVGGFDERVFDQRYTLRFSAPGEESDSAQSLAEIETAAENKDIEAVEKITWLDTLLDITFDAAAKQGKRCPQDMRGYWSIRFIEWDKPEKWVREKEKHIILLFFFQNIHLYDYFEEKYVLGADKTDSEELTEAKIIALNNKLHEKAIDELHKALMPKMSVELKLRPDTWRRHFKSIENCVWRLGRQLHLN